MLPASPRAIAPTKVAVYIRWSTEDQGEGTTLEVQREGCAHFVRSQGWMVRPDLEYVDDGYSGGTLDRPALGRLRRAVRDGLVDCVVVFKLDRLSRNVVDMVNLVLREWEDRCYLKSARENIDTYDHGGKMFFYTLVSFAEWERNTIRERTFTGRLRRAQEGRNPGRTLPYGFTTGARPGDVVTVPHEAAVVQRIFRAYGAGASVRGIAARLNAEGLPGPRGGGWAGATVARMLANETYLGTLRFGAVVREGALPAIVTREEFARVREGRGARGGGRGGSAGPIGLADRGRGRALASPYLLSGLLICGVCGGTMRCRPAYDRPHALYHCLARFHRGAAACDTAHIRQPELDALVVAELQQVYGHPERREEYIRQHLAGLNAEAARTRAALQKVRTERAAAAASEAPIRKHFRQEAISAAEYHQLMADLQQELSALREREHALLRRAGNLQAAADARDELVATARRIDQWERLTATEQKQVLACFVEQVRTFRRPGSDVVHCEVVWRSPSGGT
jgi:site-specific DNA recombinase